MLEPSRIGHSLNCLLPSSIRASSPQVVTEGFHARFSALEREYRYFAIQEPSAVMGRFTGCSNGSVDLGVMQQLASALAGTHDFSLFSRENRDGNGSLCTVREAGWYRHKGVMVFHIAANRFLRSNGAGYCWRYAQCWAGRTRAGGVSRNACRRRGRDEGEAGRCFRAFSLAGAVLIYAIDLLQ